MDKDLTNNKNTKKKLADEIATRKRAINFYSLGTYLPDPDPVLRKQGKDMAIYKELASDAHVFACIQSRKAGVLSKEWAINRGTDKDDKVLLLTQVLENLDIYSLINTILDCTLYGFQPIEIIWAKVGKLILPVEAKGKPPEWFVFDNNNKLKFRTKEHYFGINLPDRKFLCPQLNPSYENPYGERTLSRVYWPVTFKRGGLKYWVIFTEKYGIPHLIGKHPRGASKEETDALADVLEEMVQDAVAVVPDDSSVEIKEANKTSSAQVFEALVDKMNAEISKAILGQTLTTEVGSVGSYSASQTHMGVRKDIIDSDKKLVEKTINQLIKWVYEINFSTQDAIPQFEMYEIEDIDLNLAQRDKILTESGVKFTKSYFVKNYGLQEDDLEITDILPPAPPIFSQFNNDDSDNSMDEIDELLQMIVDEHLQDLSQESLNPLIELINQCSSFAQAKKVLKEKNINTKPIEDILTKALYLADCQGRVDGLGE